MIAKLLLQNLIWIAAMGALLFLPAAILGPIAEHWGPIPFGN
jgi:K+-transporting ATPase A subunit